jgi:hypothetical protein
VLTKEKRPPEARERRPELAPASQEPAVTGRAASGGKSQSGPREVRRQASSGNEQQSAERPTSVKSPAEPVRRPAQRVRGKPVRYTPSAEQSKDLSDKMSAAAASSGEKLNAAEDYLHVSEDGQYLCRLCPEIKNCKMRYRFDKHLLTVRHQNRAAADIAARAGGRAGRRGEASVSPRPAAQTAARPTKQLAAAAALNESTKELRVLLEHCPLVGGGGRNARRPRKSSSDEDEGPPEATGRTAGDAADTVSATGIARRKSPRNPQPRRRVGQGIMRHAAGQAKTAGATIGAAKKAAESGGQKPQPKKRKGAGDGKTKHGQKSQVRYRVPIG